MQHTEILTVFQKMKIFSRKSLQCNFTQNIDFVGTLQNHLGEVILTLTHNLCFGSKIRKIIHACVPQLDCINVGFKEVLMSWTRFPDGNTVQFSETFL